MPVFEMTKRWLFLGALCLFTACSSARDIPYSAQIGEAEPVYDYPVQNPYAATILGVPESIGGERYVPSRRAGAAGKDAAYLPGPQNSQKVSGMRTGCATGNCFKSTLPRWFT